MKLPQVLMTTCLRPRLAHSGFFAGAARAALLAWFVASAALNSHAADIAALFPEATQVARDFPDETERYVALNLLWDVMHQKAPDAPDARQKRSAYYQAAEGIRQKYMVQGTQAYTDFDSRMRQLTANRDFRQSVLEKYHVANLPVETPAKPLLGAGRVGLSDANIKRAFLMASPFVIAGIVAMAFIAKVLMRNSGRTPPPGPPPSRVVADVPSLPETLRVVNVPGRQYEVYMASGLAIDKETTVRTYAQTTTTPGQVYTVGNQVYSTPGRTSTTYSTTQEDLIWVRTPENHETSWTFTGGAFKVRPGHILSALVLGSPSKGGSFIFAYNHTTEQLSWLNGLGQAHMTSRGLLSWFLGSLVGSIGFAIGVIIVLSIDPDQPKTLPDQLIHLVAMYIEGLIAAVIVAAIVVFKVSAGIGKRRGACFEKEYLPKFRSFFAQCTPALQKHFGQQQPVAAASTALPPKIVPAG